MITFLLITIIAFIKSIADTIRVPAKFNASIFSKYKDNTWINPEISWNNQHKIPWYLYPFLVHLSDLWHLCWSIIISLFLLLAILYKYSEVYPSDLIMFFIWWLVYGFIFEIGLGQWKK